MKNVDFIIATTDVLEVNKEGNRIVKFRVSVPGRVAEGQVTEYNAGELNKLLTNWENIPPKLEKVIKVGQILGEALFPPGIIRDSFLGSLAVNKNNSDSQLRIILNLQGLLHLLPWEFIVFHTEQGEATQNEILGLMSQVSIIRQLDHTMPKISGIQAATLPMQMVAAFADPTSSLDLEEEHRLLEMSLGESKRIKVNYVDPATKENLLGGLDQVHLFHFAGHGEFVENPTPGLSPGKGALILNDGSGNIFRMDASQLAIRLVNNGVRIAVLGACLTAKRDEINIWSSTAANLINGGLGAVVAMQFFIQDKSAIAFSKAFYEAIALGFPVDKAVTKGRLAIFEQSDFRGFGTPVLYMGSGDGIIFPEFFQDPELKKEREKTRVVVNLSADIVEGEVTGIKVGKMMSGEATVSITSVDVVGGQLTAFDAGELTGGHVDVTVNVKHVGNGGEIIGARFDTLQ
jgi:hypothetical protein